MSSFHIRSSRKLVYTGFLVLLTLSGCASMPDPIPEPSALISPVPRDDAKGQYLSPYTSDAVVAPWVQKGLTAKVGSAAGSIATQKALENIPIASFFADRAGRAAGRAAALKLVGGMKYMRSTTDLSFDNLEDMVIYTYVHHSDHVDYSRVIDLVGDIYPSFAKKQHQILSSAAVKD